MIFAWVDFKGPYTATCKIAQCIMYKEKSDINKCLFKGGLRVAIMGTVTNGVHPSSSDPATTYMIWST